MRVERDEGTTLRSSALTIDPIQATPDVANSMALVAMMYLPTMHIDESGRFLRLDNLAATQREIRDAWDVGVPPAAIEDPIWEYTDLELRPEKLIPIIENAWSTLLGDLVGRTMTFGEANHIESQVVLPGTGQEISQHTEYTPVARIPCTEEETGPPRCVRVTMVSHSDVTDVQTFVDAQAASFGVPAVEFRRIQHEGELILEAATLVPHRMDWSEHMVLAVRDTVSTWHERRTWVFHYASDPSP